MASALSKLLWGSALRRTPWLRLFAWAAGAAAIVLVLGFVISGRDGRMATYAAMVIAIAVALWATGLRPRGP